MGKCFLVFNVDTFLTFVSHAWVLQVQQSAEEHGHNFPNQSMTACINVFGHERSQEARFGLYAWILDWFYIPTVILWRCEGICTTIPQHF